MKNFIKQNLNQILFVVLLGLVLILWGRILLHTLLKEGATAGLTDTAARVRCARSFGWEVDATSETKETLYFAKAAEAEYEKLQTLSGFDITPFYGKPVTRYTFRALNFPGDSGQEAFLHLLVYNDTFIGGDCTVYGAKNTVLPLNRRGIP